jgi:hypothetical protein
MGRYRSRQKKVTHHGSPAPATSDLLTPVAMALLVGRRDISEIARFATTLTHPQRRRLGLPRKKGTRAIVEKGGDYLLQIKANQPRLLQQAQALDALKDTPFLPKPKPDTDALISVTSRPSPSNRSAPTSPLPAP